MNFKWNIRLGIMNDFTPQQFRKTTDIAIKFILDVFICWYFEFLHSYAKLVFYIIWVVQRFQQICYKNKRHINVWSILIKILKVNILFISKQNLCKPIVVQTFSGKFYNNQIGTSKFKYNRFAYVVFWNRI